MIIKILDDHEKPLCIYTQGRWVGAVSPGILSELAEIAVFGLRNRGELVFREITKHLPVNPEQAQESS